jgi:hypothetical protein
VATYATVEELTGVDGPLDYTPVNAQQLLDRASRDVRRATKCATYDVDGDDLPTDPVVLAAMKAATLEQVCFNLTAGNSEGIRHGLQSGVPSSTSAGEIDLSRGQSVGGATSGLSWLGDQPFEILQEAGLTGQAPYTYLMP